MCERVRVSLAGAVQGVGFRPFVYRLAQELGLKGWVMNSSTGLVLEIEGPVELVQRFLDRLDAERPPASVIFAREVSILSPAGFERFEILPSDPGVDKTAGVLPDLATCPLCIADITDPANRRFRYPFTNCTNCGPRFTILRDIPYDRPNTTMSAFAMCDRCQQEYSEPSNRRFHAQPNACPVCGPHIWIEPGHSKSEGSATDSCLRTVAEALRRGRIVAMKGIGGFQLLVDARNDEAVTRLRRLKHREEKPFALMMPSLNMVRFYCVVSPAEEQLLLSPAAPIVLLRPNGRPGISQQVARFSPFLGVMLPYSPLHHLLMQEFPYPVVATSGNQSDEPIAIDNQEARERLGAVADLFLMHDRPIARPCDDSVTRIQCGRQTVLRRARGYAPLPIPVSINLPHILAVGGHLKNAIAIAKGRQVFLSQHVGDLDTAEARAAFERAIEDLCRIYQFRPEYVACDLHPDYASTQWACSSGLPLIGVQHHQAHVAACAAENNLRGSYLGVAWDGTGLGTDGTIWGGEFFLVQGTTFTRIAHLRPFRLPGGETAVKEGWRCAAALLWEMHGSEGVAESPYKPFLCKMLTHSVNTPITTSVGRLFDAVASLIGLAHRNYFEGQAAMQLEREIANLHTAETYPLPGGDWAPLVDAIQSDVRNGVAPSWIAARFHNALACWILEVAGQAGEKDVILSGGVFQNAYLVSRVRTLLEERGFRVHTHQCVPPNDGGIALGQALIAAGIQR